MKYRTMNAYTVKTSTGKDLLPWYWLSRCLLLRYHFSRYLLHGLKAGTVEDGTVEDGSGQDGTVKDGTVKAGTVKADQCRSGCLGAKIYRRG